MKERKAKQQQKTQLNYQEKNCQIDKKNKKRIWNPGF
jgi:hypothetical protein